MWVTLPTGPVRALWGGNNRLFAIGGNKLYEITSGAAVAYSGTLSTSSGPAQIVATPFGVSAALVIWDGSNGSADNIWVADGTNPLTAYISGTGIGFIDGYIVVLRPPSPPGNVAGTIPINTFDGTQINLSNLLDPTTYDPLQFAIKGGNADQLVAIYTPGSIGGPGPEELWLFGKTTIEVWYNTGGTSLNPFPFQRVPGAFINEGLWAAQSVCSLDGSLFFLGGDARGPGVVWRMNGYQPARVSTHAVEAAIQSYAVAGLDTSDAIAYAYQENGHQFYVLNFPTASKTWVYDVTEGLWHRRSFNGTTAADSAWYHAWTLGRHFVGDGTSGNVYVSSLSVFQDNGTAITFQRTTPIISNDNKWVRYNKFELLFGGPFNANLRTFTLNSGDGQTYGADHTITVGPGGNSPNRAVQRWLGRARKRNFKITTTDNLAQAWVDGLIDYTPGTGE